MTKKAVISLSGGLDSTMLLMTLLSERYEVRAYAFDYGQKHTIELEKVQKNLQSAGDQLEEVMGKRTRAIERKLRQVEALPIEESSKMLSLNDIVDEED